RCCSSRFPGGEIMKWLRSRWRKAGTPPVFFPVDLQDELVAKAVWLQNINSRNLVCKSSGWNILRANDRYLVLMQKSCDARSFRLPDFLLLSAPPIAGPSRRAENVRRGPWGLRDEWGIRFQWACATSGWE